MKKLTSQEKERIDFLNGYITYWTDMQTEHLKNNKELDKQIEKEINAAVNELIEIKGFAQV